MARCRRSISKRPATGISLPRMSAASPISSAAKLRKSSSAARDDHPIPAEPAIGLVARGRVERDHPLCRVLIEAAGLALELERQPLAQDTLAIGCGDDAELGVDQQH